MAKKAIFLDRDGTINVDKEYVYKKTDFELLPNALSGLKRMQEGGYMLIIITNQSGIGRGYYSVEDYRGIMNELYSQLEKKGIKIEGDYFCRHAPEEDCECRKPKISMIKEAAKDHGIDLKQSYFIGDKTADILAGSNAGCKTILVLTGKAGKDNSYKAVPDYICDDLLEASKIVRRLCPESARLPFL